MALEFEWDPEKSEAHRKKHRVSFDEASTAFADPLSLTIPDSDHSEREERMLLDNPKHSGEEECFVLFGESGTGQLLAVMHTDRGGRLRLISAREMTRRERNQYAKFHT